MGTGGNLKYLEALQVASKDSNILAKHRQYSRMDRNTLYTVLEAFGYSWDTALQVWTPRQTLVLQAPQQLRTIKAHQNTLNNVFLVRIMAPKDSIGKIEADLYELAEALNWEIQRDSREYPNEGDSNWVRKYYTVRRD